MPTADTSTKATTLNGPFAADRLRAAKELLAAAEGIETELGRVKLKDDPSGIKLTVCDDKGKETAAYVINRIGDVVHGSSVVCDHYLGLAAQARSQQGAAPTAETSTRIRTAFGPFAADRLRAAKELLAAAEGIETELGRVKLKDDPSGIKLTVCDDKGKETAAYVINRIGDVVHGSSVVCDHYLGLAAQARSRENKNR